MEDALKVTFTQQPPGSWSLQYRNSQGTESCTCLLRNLYADDPTLMAESEDELKNLLMKVKEWKSWLKAQHSENYDHGI